jgi:hypothetical protein
LNGFSLIGIKLKEAGPYVRRDRPSSLLPLFAKDSPKQGMSLKANEILNYFRL